jgi:hypothetical protein
MSEEYYCDSCKQCYPADPDAAARAALAHFEGLRP